MTTAVKTFSFNFNDFVQATLTGSGAEHLSCLCRNFYDSPPKLTRGRTDYKEGDIYKGQFWSLVRDFEGPLYLGTQGPFEGGIINVESSMED